MNIQTDCYDKDHRWQKLEILISKMNFVFYYNGPAINDKIHQWSTSDNDFPQSSKQVLDDKVHFSIFIDDTLTKIRVVSSCHEKSYNLKLKEDENENGSYLNDAEINNVIYEICSLYQKE